MSKQMERKAGSWYNVRSFQLLINDGNYYLIVYADYTQGNMDNRNI